MHRTALIAVFVCSSLFATPLLAQPHGAQAKGAASQGQRTGNRLARFGFDTATVQKVQQIHQTYRKERQSIKRQTQTHRQRISQLLKAKSNDQNSYRTALTGLKNARAQMKASKDREMAELERILTPKQQALLIRGSKRYSNNRANPTCPCDNGRWGHRQGSRPVPSR